jgi:quinoprotein glucose dehydrogenase
MAYIQGNPLTGPRTSGGAGSSAGGGRTEFEAQQRQVAVSTRGNPPRGILVDRLPLQKPPYGKISALDLRDGSLAWQIAHGQTPDRVANHPALASVDIPRTGQSASIGTLVTKTLLIAGEAEMTTGDDGEHRAMLRAYDKANGEEVGALKLPAPQTGSPMTYMLDGEQYLVLAVSGSGYSGELIAFKL